MSPGGRGAVALLATSCSAPVMADVPNTSAPVGLEASEIADIDFDLRQTLALAEAQEVPGQGMAPTGPTVPAPEGPPDDPADLDVSSGPESSNQTFGAHLKKAKWEIGAVAAYITVPRIARRIKQSAPFHFHSEGWFGKSTYSLGMDKMLHAYKTYVITDVLQSVIARRTGDTRGAAITAGIVGAGLMTWAEVFDGFSTTTGFSYEDGLVHLAGAGVSVLRNTVPGLRDKVDFRLEFKPKFDGTMKDTRGRLAQSKYLIAVQLDGFKRFERSPLRFAELQFGYYARGFSAAERLAGDPLKRRLFVGVGFNVQALFSRKPKSSAERIARGAFDYIQVPYTALRTR